MSSRKRWNRIYPETNPFELAQGLMRELNTCKCAANRSENVEYLWIHLPAEPSAHADSSCRPLTADEWLSVIDESAANGAKTIIITLDSSFSERDEVRKIAEWAQNTHEMLVGFHLVGFVPTREDGAVIASLDRCKTRVLMNREELNNAPFLESLGVRLVAANGLEEDHVHHECTLPKSMACLGPDGSMYTCGLVFGREQYHMGSYFDRRLDRCIHDESLPHSVPPDVPRDGHHCDGCPPLMAERMRDKTA
ncbi:MAG: hypothetical protein AMXMBFR84_14010 [Candidatus Hydrogenedentota bacterium]